MKGSAQTAVQLPDVDDAPIRPQSPIRRGATHRSPSLVRPLAFPGPSVPPPPPVAAVPGLELTDVAGDTGVRLSAEMLLRVAETSLRGPKSVEGSNVLARWVRPRS